MQLSVFYRIGKLLAILLIAEASDVAQGAPLHPAGKSVQADEPLRPIIATHTVPPYPEASVHLNEQGTTLMEVHITTEGNVDNCKIVSSSSSQTLDETSCAYVQNNWRWRSPTFKGKPQSVSTRVSVKWDLRDAQLPSPGLIPATPPSSFPARINPTGVTTPDQIAEYKARCLAYGYKASTSTLAECVMKLDLAHRQSIERSITAERSALAAASMELDEITKQREEAERTRALETSRRLEEVRRAENEREKQKKARRGQCLLEMSRVLGMPMNANQNSQRWALAARAKSNCENGQPPPAELSEPLNRPGLSCRTYNRGETYQCN